MSVPLKPCPFCGGEARLRKIRSGYKTSPNVTISNDWIVECKNGCCETKVFRSEIYEDKNGDIRIEGWGPGKATSLWNGQDIRPTIVIENQDEKDSGTNINENGPKGLLEWAKYSSENSDRKPKDKGE